MVNPCKCIDCGGDQPNHSPDCTYMMETFGCSEPSEECPDCGKTFGDGVQCQHCDWYPHDHFGD